VLIWMESNDQRVFKSLGISAAFKWTPDKRLLSGDGFLFDTFLRLCYRT